MTADLVVADLSIHNANVFYELGIRHGVRPNATFLLRAKSDRKYPFDLQTDRYLTYDTANPAASVVALAEALDATLNSGRTDSPVYQLLPNLRAPDPATLRVVPSEFMKRSISREGKLRGDLRLLAYEARSFPWASLGLRAVGRAQFLIKATLGDRDVRMAESAPAERRRGQSAARHALPEVGIGLTEDGRAFTKSNAAIQRVIDSPEPNSWDMAEAYALKARNIKTRWLKRLEAKTGADAQIAALRSSELEAAFEAYASGFAQDRNHFYSGLNALSPTAHAHRPGASATGRMVGSVRLRQQSDGGTRSARGSRAATGRWGVELAIEAKQLALARQRTRTQRQSCGPTSPRPISFPTATRPKAVSQKYRQPLSDAPSFAVDAVRNQIKIFEQLGLRLPFVAEALSVTGAGDSGATTEIKGRALLFTDT